MERPIGALCLSSGLLICSLFIVTSVANTASIEDALVWTITIKHYGVDAKEMERAAAIPLEDALSAIENIKSIVTSSENGSVRAYIVFNNTRAFFGGAKKAGRYEAVREAAQRVYESLPSSAQRPEITSASESRTPVWTAAVFFDEETSASAAVLEKSVKPAFLGLEGVADVEVSGTGLGEIVITLRDKALGQKLTAADVARILAENDALIPAGYVREGGMETALLVDGRYDGLAGLEAAYLPLEDGSVTTLGAVAEISEREREPDILARLNGKKAAMLSVIPVDGCDTGKLSAAIKKMLQKPEMQALQWTVLSDRGEEETRSFRSVCFAALQGAAAVALLSFLVMRRSGSGRGGAGTGLRQALILSAAIPFICLVSAALMLILGVNLSKTALAGISTGLGGAIDACLLCAEQLSQAGRRARQRLAKLRTELVSGSATTIIALLPLGLLPFAAGDITTLACALACVTFTALVCALVLLPPLFVSCPQKEAAGAGEEYGRIFGRYAAKNRAIRSNLFGAPSGTPKSISASIPCAAQKSASMRIFELDGLSRSSALIRLARRLRALPPWRAVRAGFRLSFCCVTTQQNDKLKHPQGCGCLSRHPCRPSLRQTDNFGGLLLTFIRLSGRVRRRLRRLFAHIVWMSCSRPVGVIAAAVVVCGAALLTMFLAGTDTGYNASEDSVYAHVEFEAAITAQEIDDRLALWAGQITGISGVKNIQTGARTGSGSALITFDPKLLDTEAVRDIARQSELDGGFVYIGEGSAKDRSWTINITGDDDKKCRELAREFARACAAIPLVKETVLNFKDGSSRLTFTPNRPMLALMNAAAGGRISYSRIADELRRAVHGPVAYKRLNKTTGGAYDIDFSGETDVRVKEFFAEMPRKKDVEAMYVYGGASEAVQISRIMDKSEEAAGSSIRRQDRRRCAGITIRTKPMDPRKVRDVVMAAFSKIEMPAGYYAEFDRGAIENARALSGSVFYFLLALLLCYMIMAAANESFVLPLIVLAVVPPSVGFSSFAPALFGLKLNAAAACAFIAVSGMAVNAAVISAGELYGKGGFGRGDGAAMGSRGGSPKNGGRIRFGFVYLALRRRLNVLSVTTFTTLVSALPFLFLRENTNTLVRTLAMITALGVSASYIFSITLVPAIISLVRPRGGYSEKNA
jgi:multidrug efflux pump subunit AcrB